MAGFIGVRGSAGTGYLVPARGLGGGWEIHVSSAAALHLVWTPKKVVLVVNVCFTTRV